MKIKKRTIALQSPTSLDRKYSRYCQQRKNEEEIKSKSERTKKRMFRTSNTSFKMTNAIS